jgi:hypothetical protein
MIHLLPTPVGTHPTAQQDGSPKYQTTPPQQRSGTVSLGLTNLVHNPLPPLHRIALPFVHRILSNQGWNKTFTDQSEALALIGNSPEFVKLVFVIQNP